MFDPMRQIVLYTILLSCLLFPACAGQPATAPTREAPVFSVTTQNADDEVTLRFVEGQTVIEIQSPTGIGSAVFRLEAGQLPERIVARLHLAGLEQLRLVTEEVTVAASVSGGEAQDQKIISGKGEQALRSSDALWLDIQIVAESATIPLKDGYFEVHFPEEFIEQAGGVFEIHWIDFYR
jgi:hypothetical protein